MTTTFDLEPNDDSSVQGNRKGRPALSNLRRELSEEELSSPGVARMLLDALDRSETEAGEVREFRDRFHSADKEAAVAKEQLRALASRDMVLDGALAIGAVLIGLTPSAWAVQPVGWIIAVLGAALLCLFILAKWLKRFRS